MSESLKNIIYTIAVSGAKIYWRVMKPRTYGARVVLLYTNLGAAEPEVLLVQPRKSSYWNLPGGGIKRGEHPHSGALRELREETGIKVEGQVDTLGVYTSSQEGKQDTIHIVVAETSDRKIPRLEIEIQQAKWFPVSQLPEKITRPTQYRIQECLAGLRDLTGVWTQLSQK
jgi:8-oxo-dGTP pyrophosphatase MutT (NUDIX family)